MTKTIYDLTEQDIREVLEDMFMFDHLESLEYDGDGIHCIVKGFIGGGWFSRDEVCIDFNEDPFGDRPIDINYSNDASGNAIETWRQFCYAHGIVPSWISENPYL